MLNEKYFSLRRGKIASDVIRYGSWFGEMKSDIYFI